MFFYNCSVFVYSTVAGLKYEINPIVIVTVNRRDHDTSTSQTDRQTDLPIRSAYHRAVKQVSVLREHIEDHGGLVYM